MNNRTRQRLLIIMVLAAILSVFPKAGLTITIKGTGTYGSFTGDLRYSSADSSAAELVIELTNRSDPVNGGFITGFAFNNPGDSIKEVTLTAPGTFPDFQLLGGDTFDDTIKASPFGKFDIGAALGGDFLGGGSPKGGIGIGETASFAFTLTGKNLDTLNDSRFISELSTGDQFFIARFKGFENSDSDKVPATAPVPEPATIFLLGSGLAALGIFGMRRFKRSSAG